MAASATAAAPAAAPRHELTIEVTHIRNASGTIRLAVCPDGSGFPRCRPGTGAELSLPAARGTVIARTRLPAGRYAIAVLHDENSNGKLDTMLGIPREGYGFSRNPPFRPRAPRFEECAVSITGPQKQSVVLRYL